MVGNFAGALFHSQASVSMALVGVLVAPYLWVGAAAAQSTPAPEVSAPAPEPPEGSATAAPTQPPQWGATYHHRGQVGLSLMPGASYRMIVPYEENVFCGGEGADSQRVCTGRGPTFIDLELSFGVTAKLDLLVATRFGLEKDFSKSRQFALMPGLRIWLDQDEALKFYTTIQLVYDNTDQLQFVSNSDYGGRAALGFMYDPIPNIGFFTQVGATIGAKRWFRLEADLGIGVQVRLP